MDFIKYKFIGFFLSLVFIIASVSAIIAWGFNFGIDFKGGTLMEFKFSSKKTITSINKVFEETDSSLLPSITSSGKNSFIIRAKDIDNETHDKLIKNIKDSLGEFTEPRFTTIGPTIGATMKEKALIALAVASVMIVLYIAFAFRKIPRRMNPWKFGIAAILALIHDIIITVGIFAVLGKFLNVEIDSLFITALLTILGFSVHDTIVVFDRIRENLKQQSREETFSDTANKSINQTLIRSINTSFTNLITLSFLFFLGGESIKYFVLALIVGTVVGTYSSIFIASPILVVWQKKY